MGSERIIARYAREKIFTHSGCTGARRQARLVPRANSSRCRVPAQAGAANQVEQVPRTRTRSCSRSRVNTFIGLLTLALMKSYYSEVDVFLDLGEYCGGVGGMQACMP